MDKRIARMILGLFLIFIRSAYSSKEEDGCLLHHTYIHCKGSDRVVLPSVGISNVESIFFTFCNMSTLTGEDFAPFPQVINIEIRSSNLSFPTNNALFKKINDLKYLRVENCDVGEEVWEMFEANESLERLSLTKNRITSISRRLLSKLPRLQELDLSGNGASSLEDGALDQLKELRSLDLRDNALEGGSAGVVALTLDRCSACRPLGMSFGCSVTEVSQCVAGRPLDRIWWRSSGLTLRLEGNPVCNESTAPLEIESLGELYQGDMECDIQEVECSKQDSRKLFFDEACGKKHPNSSDVSGEERYVIKAGIAMIAFYTTGTIIGGILIGGLLTFLLSKKKKPEEENVSFDRNSDEVGIGGGNVKDLKSYVEVEEGISRSVESQGETDRLIGSISLEDEVNSTKLKVHRSHSIANCDENHDTIGSTVSPIPSPLLEECLIPWDNNNHEGLPLHKAALEGDLKKMHQLLEDEEDPRKRNSREESALWFAILGGHQKVVQLLCQKAPEDVQSHNQSGDTPLHVAAHEGNGTIAKILLESNALHCARNKNGETPLHIAVYRRNLEILELLLDNPDCINQGNIQGNTPLFLAVRICQVKFVHILLEKGADPNIQNVRGERPVHIACWHGRGKIVQILLNKGAKLNVKDRYGNTELHVACRKGHMGIVKKLLTRGSDIDAVNIKGHTPLHRAVKGDHSKLVEFLIEKGADVGVESTLGETALDKARKLRKQECVDVFMKKRKFKSMENIARDDHLGKAYPSSQNSAATI